MEQEQFTIMVNATEYTILTLMPAGPYPVVHEVMKYDSLIFKIKPQLTENQEPCWALTSEYFNLNINNELVRAIGEAIEQHYFG